MLNNVWLGSPQEKIRRPLARLVDWHQRGAIVLAHIQTVYFTLNETTAGRKLFGYVVTLSVIYILHIMFLLAVYTIVVLAIRQC